MINNYPIYIQQKAEIFAEVKDLNSYFDKVIEAVIYVDKTKEIDTKNKDKMMFITGSDELSQVDIVVFPRVYENMPIINNGDILKIIGKVEKRYDQYQIVAINIVKLEN